MAIRRDGPERQVAARALPHLLRDARGHFRDQVDLGLRVLDRLQQRTAAANKAGAGSTASTSSPPR